MTMTTKTERHDLTHAAESAKAGRPRLRTAVKAGGLLDEPAPTPRGPARDRDGNPLPEWWV